MCDEAIKNASSPRRDNICSLVEAIGFLNSPTNVINEKYLQKNVPPSKWYGVLLTLIDPKLAKLDLFGLQRKVFSWFDTNQQTDFIACVDIDTVSPEFRKCLIDEVSKQIDRKQIQTSMFYVHNHFREKVQSFTNIASHMDQHIQDDLQLAKQLIECFNKVWVHSATPGAFGLGPIPQLWATLKTIYLSDQGDVSKDVKKAEDVLIYLNAGARSSLGNKLMINWDQELAKIFAGGAVQPQHSTQRPPREKTPTGRQASPKRSGAEPKPHPTHPQGYMGPNQSGTGKQSARVYIVVSLLAVGAIGLFSIGFTAGRSQSVAVVDHVDDGIDQNETSSSNAREDGEGPPPEPVVEPPDNSGGGTANTGQIDAEKAAADKMAADKKAADKKAADKKAADKKAADKKAAAVKRAADEAKKKAAAALANKPVVHQPPQFNGIRDDNFTPPLDKLYFHEIKLAELTAVTPKIIAIPAGDLRASKPGWPQPGKFSIRKSEKTENLWEVVRDEDKLTYAYLEWDKGKRILRVYRAQPGNNVPEKQFGAKATIPAEPNKQQVERLDRRGNRFLSYCHLIQLDEKTFFSMGLNQALAQSRVAKKTAEILMARKVNTEVFFAPSIKLLNHMADLRLVSRPSTWSIELDKVYEKGGQPSSVAYKAVPANAFAGTPHSKETASGGKYSGLNCKYTDFAMGVQFVAQTAQMELQPRGNFKSLEDLMEEQQAVGVQEYRLDELMKKPQGTFDQMRARDIEIKRTTGLLNYARTAVVEFITANSKLTELRDDPEATTALVTYYRSVNNAKGLSVSLTISRRQNINGQEVVIPFWYPVIP
jgi:hypothetical protein